MEDQLIAFETAKLAKEKGFNEFYQSYYYDKDGNEWIGFSSNTRDYEDKYTRSSQSLLQKWLRETYKIHIEIYFNYKKYCITVLGNSEVKDMGFEYSTYEEALETGLQEALKLIK